jgi:YHS domain-containing protein
VTRPRCLAAAAVPFAALIAAFALAALAPGSGFAQRFVPQKDASHPRLKYADSLVSINDRCAVKESPLSPVIRPVYVNGKPVGFCCTTCPGIFVQGPEPYLERMHAKFTDPVHPDRPAQVAARLRYHVNWEIYYFADRAGLDEFRKNPTRYCGLVTDPVSGGRFRPDERSPRVFHGGRSYFFMTDRTREVFQSRPIDFAIRKGA